MAAKRKSEGKPVEVPETPANDVSEAEAPVEAPKAEKAGGAPYRVAKGKALCLRRGVASEGAGVTLKDLNVDEAAAKAACEKLLAKGYLTKA